MMQQHGGPGMRFNHQNSAQIGPPGTLRLSPSTMNGHPSAMVGHPMGGQSPSPHHMLQQQHMQQQAAQAAMAQQHAAANPASNSSSSSISSVASPNPQPPTGHQIVPQPPPVDSPQPRSGASPKGAEPVKEGGGGPLNMTLNNSDIRTNSIAALRIKAKEHLENINKGLTIA